MKIQRVGYKIVRFGYLLVIKPILFLFVPDKTHDSMVKFAHWFGSVKFLRKFMRWLFVAERDERLVQKYKGIEFVTPVGLAAGFDKNAEIIPAMSSLGFGFGTIGSATARRCEGNPRPWFYRLPKTQSLVINVGFANNGIEDILSKLHKTNQKMISKFPIKLSIAQTNSQEVSDEDSGIKDYLISIKQATREKKISIIELNIHCPNHFGGESFTDPGKLHRLLLEVDKVRTQKPIFIKFPSDLSWCDARLLLDTIIKHEITGVVISYLSGDRTNAELHDELSGRVKGGLSGKPTRWLSNELIRLTYKNYGDKLMIIGGGGVFSAEDAYAKIKFGANLVELVTGLIVNGPQVVAEINDGLVKLLEQDGYEHISQAIGVDVIDL